MPGWELIDKERIALNNLVKKEGGILFAHGFNNLKKNLIKRV